MTNEHLQSEVPTMKEPKCSDHPDAPHGFCRDASHSAGRYVCECEGWEAERKLSEQEPVAWKHKQYGYTSTDNPNEFGDDEDWIPLYTIPPDQSAVPTMQEHLARIAELESEKAELLDALKVLERFAGKVGGSSSFWEDVWFDYEKRIAIIEKYEATK